jgi:flagellar motor switch protein FliN/FliY
MNVAEETEEQSNTTSEEEGGVATEEKSERPAAFGNLETKAVSSRPPITGNINLLLDVPLKVTVQLGSVKMLIKDLLHLGPGSIIELSKIAGDPMDIFIGEKMIARGEVIVVNGTFGVRIIDIVSPEERIETLNK